MYIVVRGSYVRQGAGQFFCVIQATLSAAQSTLLCHSNYHLRFIHTDSFFFHISDHHEHLNSIARRQH